MELKFCFPSQNIPQLLKMYLFSRLLFQNLSHLFSLNKKMAWLKLKKIRALSMNSPHYGVCLFVRQCDWKAILYICAYGKRFRSICSFSGNLYFHHLDHF